MRIVQRARRLSASLLLTVAACGGVAARSMQPDASAGRSNTPPTSGEDAATTTETSDALSGDANLIGPIDAGVVEVDTGMTEDAACTPITITFDASGYPHLASAVPAHRTARSTPVSMPAWCAAT